jgi:leucyl aminopeptidase
MEVKVVKGRLREIPSDLAVMGQFEEGLSKELLWIDKRLKGRIRELVKSGEFTGKFPQISLLHIAEEIAPRRLLLVGLGKRGEFTLERIRQAMGKVAVRVRDLGLSSFTTPILESPSVKVPVREAAQAAIEGIILGTYQFNRYKTDSTEPKKEIREVKIVEPDEKRLVDFQMGATRGRLIAEATCYARDLCNAPSNDITPSRLASEAKAIAEAYGLGLQVMERREMEQMGMGAFMGVARGTQEPPKLIVLEYRGGKRPDRAVALVGKSVTFDSGGISLKPAEKMEQMKYDMSGGATVLGTIKVAAQLKIPVNVIGILPATDNMPGGTAIHPGDVVKTLSGKTVEVVNTDAEGRLCLADALTYATRFKPAAIIDLATLTGACVIALGNHAIGLLGNQPKLAEQVRKAGEKTGERVWELPLWPEYDEQIKSDVADLKNVGGRPGGTITAAAFLKQFVGEYPWVHLDIAGTAWSEENRPYVPKGSTGVGVRLLVQFLSDHARNSK